MQISFQKFSPKLARCQQNALMVYIKTYQKKTLNLKENPGSLFGNWTVVNSRMLNILVIFIMYLNSSILSDTLKVQ